MNYRRRVFDDTLDELFPQLAAIAIEGAKGVGKTATATQRVRTAVELDDPAQRQALLAGFDLITELDGPLLIDEWQLMPPVWDRVRRAVDANSSGGQFLLTGSANVPPTARIHSGAGRIVSLVMRPLSFAERAIQVPTVSLRNLLTGEQPPISGNSSVTARDYAAEIMRSGFPESVICPSAPGASSWTAT